jgi:hypothetical protein
MSDNWKTKAAILTIGSLALIRVGFAFFPDGRFWGVNQLAYFPAPIAAVFAGVFLAAMLCCLNDSLVRKLGDIYSGISTKFDNSRLIFGFATVLVSLGMFLFFKDSTNLLGDGLLRIGELQNKRIDNFISQHSAEPLDYLIHYYFYVVLLVFFKIKPIVSYQILSAIAGVLYVFGARYFSNQLPKEAKEFGFWYLLGWGGLMLFFGYVESYALAAAAIIFFFGYSLRVLKESGNIAILAVLFLLAFFLHNAAIVFFPAVVYLLLINYQRQKGRSITILTIVSVIVIGWTFIGINFRQAAGLMLPSSLSEPNYGLFGLAHMGDMINELLLVSPTFPVLIWLQNWSSSNRQKQIRAFYWLTAAGGLIFLAMADPVLGMGRDWDLFSLPLLGFHVALLIGVDWASTSIRLRATIIAFLLFSAAAWIGVNYSGQASVERYKILAGLDQARSRYAYERLGTYLLLNQKWPEAEEVYQLSLNKEPHYRTYLGLAYIQAQLGKKDSAQANYEKALELNPEQAMALYSLCQMYIKEGRLVQARDLFERLRRVSSGGIVNITEKGIRELESTLLKAEMDGKEGTDTVKIR